MHHQMAVFVLDEGKIVSSGFQRLAEAYCGKNALREETDMTKHLAIQPWS